MLYRVVFKLLTSFQVTVAALHTGKHLNFAHNNIKLHKNGTFRMCMYLFDICVDLC